MEKKVKQRHEHIFTADIYIHSLRIVGEDVGVITFGFLLLLLLLWHQEERKLSQRKKKGCSKMNPQFYIYYTS